MKLAPDSFLASATGYFSGAVFLVEIPGKIGDFACFQLQLKEGEDIARRATDILRPIAQDRNVAFGAFNRIFAETPGGSAPVRSVALPTDIN
jgi:hypothetical protein